MKRMLPLFVLDSIVSAHLRYLLLASCEHLEYRCAQAHTGYDMKHRLKGVAWNTYIWKLVACNIE